MIKNIDKKEKTKMLKSLLRSGLSIRESGQIIGWRYDQSTYALKKEKTSRGKLNKEIKKKKKPRLEDMENAVDLLKKGATPEEVVMLTGVSLSYLMKNADKPPYPFFKKNGS